MGCLYQQEIFHGLFTLCLMMGLCTLCLLMGLCTSSFVQLNDDVLGLIVFKADLRDPRNVLSSWTEDDNSPCNWMGIACDARSSRVITVHLEGLSLSGRIGRGLGKVSYLQTLSLAYNNLSGTIPADLAQLTLLKTIDLSHNMLSGRIDAAVGDLSSLRSLDLSYNHLSGAIPSHLFSNCKGLRYVSLRNNFLEGSIPYTLGSCTDLRTLDLSNNQLNGTMPGSMAALTSLLELDVSHNMISGSLPALSPNLVSLSLQSNALSGGISPAVGTCVLLQHLDLSDNLLSSELPSTMQKLASLSFLSISNNVLYGNVPLWIGSLSLLKLLNLSYNALYGQIPATLGFLKAIENVDFSHNKLSGPIPEKLLVPGMVSLKLADNLLTGQLPSAFFNLCGSLVTLDMSQNQLIGALPHIEGCVKMVYFNMSNNWLAGNLNDLHLASGLTVVDLSHNQLYGDVPPRFGNISKLSILTLESNRLNGTISSALGNCTALTEINFSQNHLYGNIPPQLGNLKQLTSLDLSHNNFSGSLPPELGQSEKLVALDVSYNQLQGPIPTTGSYVRFNTTAFRGNADLCGAIVNVTCPGVMPKPIVLNPNSSNSSRVVSQNPLNASKHKRILLSASAILAISAAAAISAGVVIVSILNGYVHSGVPRSYSDVLQSFSPSPSPDLPSGKLVMFSKNLYPRAEEWITTVHALLNKDSELGRGGFGTVYKAVLGDGRMVAIKKLMASSMVKSQEDFEKEIQFLGSIKHHNLLELQGYYWTPQLQLLISDFISNGNLYSRLHEKNQANSPLTWARRFKIALGTAHGLAHLHHACCPQVIHYNMKSSNILLDEDCNPKIADYGLTKLLPMLDKYLMSSKYQSSLGYMAPELACQSSRINEKCDVYGYGVMVLELVTGRRPVEYREDDVVILCDYVRALLEEGKAMSCADWSMQGYVEDEVLPLIKLGLICTSQVPSNRPSMAEVVQILELIRTPASSRDML